MAALPLAPPPQPAAVHIDPNIARSIITRNAPENVRRRRGAFEWRFTPSASKKSKMMATVRPAAARRTWNGVERGKLENGRIPLVPPLVVTDTINGAACRSRFAS
jgi:hypothetical protein